MDVPADWPVSRCRSQRCGKAVWWAYTDTGQRMPVDPTPAPDGNLILTVVDGEIRAEVRKTTSAAAAAEQADLFGTAPAHRYRPHWASCPDAEQFKTRSKVRRQTA